ncbi:hypothetical protein [Streptomyces sp. LN785]|uniref:hypothetical protein n=1 Tax=Streptomyces sp. LN785 TaxID=3112983 RepID=UPI003722FDE4
MSLLANTPECIYLPGKSVASRRIHGWQEELLKLGKANPTTGHFSDASTNKGASLTTAMNDTVLDIVAGRKPVSTFQVQLKKWRSGGGDEIRAEFEASVAGK